MDDTTAADQATEAKRAAHAALALQAAIDRHAGWQLQYDMTLVIADRKRLLERIAELETERGHADTRLRVEHYRLQARNSEARALANGWRTYTLQQRGEDGEWIAMHEAFGAILAALDGDAGGSDDTGSSGTEG